MHAVDLDNAVAKATRLLTTAHKDELHNTVLNLRNLQNAYEHLENEYVKGMQGIFRNQDTRLTNQNNIRNTLV